jgi:hypothetical protein
MKLTEDVREKLMSFDFRFIEQIEGSICRVKYAKTFFENPSKPHVLDDTHMCFWHDGCVDHAYRIYLKDILIF